MYDLCPNLTHIDIDTPFDDAGRALKDASSVWCDWMNDEFISVKLLSITDVSELVVLIEAEH